MKEIKKTKGLYFASIDGGIYRNGKCLSPINNGNDYLCVVLCVDGKTKRQYIHRLIAETFIDNPLNKKEVNHIDGVRTNNRLSNLEWVTRSENHFHRYKVLKKKGVNFGKTGVLNWRSKKVQKFDLEWNLLETYPAVMEAMRITGINEASIRACIYGKQKTAGGFKWKYE